MRLTNFKICCFECWACEQPGEDHVYRDREAMTHISLSYLDVLNLCGISGVAFSAACNQNMRQSVINQIT